ncbi:MAG: TlpA family protein disulfide reductase [Gammaproteobacteria bacterium]|nr:TlpA family protein disulfide reductase [Gammaproteobacteria bacterium]
MMPGSQSSRLGAVGLLLMLVACDSAPPPLTDRLSYDRPLPALKLTSLDGSAASLVDYRGKLVVLNIWATWCEPCRRELPNLQALSESLDPERFAVLGLAEDDDPHLVREYLNDKGVRFPNYVDPGRALATDVLGVQVFPYTLLIAPDGTFIERVPGPREWQQPEVRQRLERAFRGDYTALRRATAP